LSKNTCIQITKYYGDKFSDKENEIVKRFAAAFEQTYIRFLDLQKAEEQARESEIQLGLERVRARTMAMHQSDELAETAAIVFQQMTELGVSPERINICLIKEAENVLEVWATDQQGIKISHHFNASLDEPTTGKPIYDAWKDQKKSLVIDLSGKELNHWIRYVREEMGMTIKDELIKEHRIHSVAFFSQGMILTTTPEPLPEESIKLLERFADVFNLTYRRFLDLQKAEAQARDAQIEAALERVRSIALGMRKSEEVGNVTDSFFDEFNKLTVKIIGCSIIVADEKKDSMEIWRARSDVAVKPFSKSSLTQSLKIIKEQTPETYSEFHKALGSKKGYLELELSGEKRLRSLNSIAEQSGFTPKERENYIKTMPAEFVASFLFFKLGYLALISENKLPDDNLTIARRFVDVFDFAYTRFLDLKVAEEQAREAVKQASLDRVRGEIASMRTTEDLNRITPIIWHELKALEVPFIRCGVFIIDEDIEVTHVYLTTPEGKSLGVLNLNFDVNELTTNTVKYWRKKDVYKEHWDKQGFIDWTKSMMKLGQVQNTEIYQGSSAPPESLYLHFVPFAQGMLYVGDVSPLTDEKLDLVKTLAEAFSIAYARYEDFNRVETTNEELNKLSGELKIKNKELENENERKAIELEEARELQLAMLPKEIPQFPGLDIKVYMQTATEVGGDYYDFSSHIDGSYNIAIGDATGHGMKAGTLVTMMKSLFVANSAGKDIEGFFMSSNAAIKNSNLKRMMVGFAMLNISDHKVRYINAGMPSVYHFVKNEKKIKEIKQHNMPLGAMKIEKYNATEINLNKGDVLLLMTDGFPELHNPSDELFGYERVLITFEKVAEKEPEEIINYLNEEGNRWRKDKELQDDFTFVVVKIK
ncbi:MAG TPA: SpoIIE family protein phosphatase, partial [Ignavibacteriaceae bacterium]|nr:SpoIIE family protein phosphatase [Ignavibacteriaceae bacterium]